MANILHFTRKEKRAVKKAYNIISTIPDIIKAIVDALHELSVGFKNIAINFKRYRTGGYTPISAYRIVQNMNPREFEFFCAELFKTKGYTAKVTAAGGDYGRDIILKDKNGEVTFVECKHYSNTKIGREICMKLLGSAATFNVDKCIIITTSQFHKNAYEIQRMVGDRLELIDKGDIYLAIFAMKADTLNRIINKTLGKIS